MSSPRPFPLKWFSSKEENSKWALPEGSKRVIRGGSWFFDRAGIKVADREGGNPTFRYGYIGFRLCRSAAGI